ncbi:isoprenoid biosynthesis glyoxalase ElbB [Marinospirillum sp.]|uniref:isoprenoid biosynthesis glyoxalase ElbB n=1 Tax=Marinospirillum sp. TaxID=2183934 RepID=UPI0028708FCA|nr:isoprenoid biosynthesis glyoxalase ElbB [Marinospirillum sp.]MDR9468364.1 isoprenoid biosynthesis glyoxalase ElbB [Marinospirillum sp.]
MQKKIAVILSGCGFQDGAEIYESVLTLLRLDEKNVSYQCLAPDIPQMHVINHATGDETPDSQPQGSASRSVLAESARVARGEIQDLANGNPDDFDAVILPGGFGVAKNLSTFATQGADCEVNQQVQQFVQAFHKAGKPIGLMCIAPALTAKLVAPGALCTIGNDPGIEGALVNMGALHKTCPVNEIVVDNTNKLVTTPAYLLATRLTEAQAGIFKLVDKVLEMA